MSKARNILFIMFDQLRFDYLSCAGHPHLETPNIDWLASRSVRFDRAYVQSPVCGASRMSFYTGRYISSHESISMDYLREQSVQARNYGGAEEVNFKTKHCNLWVRSEVTWIQDDVWMDNEHSRFTPEEGQLCYGGLDLASVNDWSALCLAFPREDGGYDTKRFYWLPEAAVEQRLYKDENTIYLQLKQSGPLPLGRMIPLVGRGRPALLRLGLLTLRFGLPRPSLLFSVDIRHYCCLSFSYTSSWSWPMTMPAIFSRSTGDSPHLPIMLWKD